MILIVWGNIDGFILLIFWLKVYVELLIVCWWRKNISNVYCWLCVGVVSMCLW